MMDKLKEKINLLLVVGVVGRPLAMAINGGLFKKQKKEEEKKIRNRNR